MLLSVPAGLLFCGSLVVEAFEEYEDLSASVEVAETFTLSLDNPSLAFHQVRPGEAVVLGEGRFFNEVTCRSNTGKPWYLRAQLVSLRHTTRQYTLPPLHLTWKLADITGAGTAHGSGGEFEAFSDQPSLIYVGGGQDTWGGPVILRFQYRLTPPSDAPAGDYVGQLMFTMSESP